MPQTGVCTRLPQRLLPQHDTDAATWAVTAHRSDGPKQPKNNAGERHFVLPAAYMMMAFYTDREVATDRWALYIGIPQQRGFLQTLARKGETLPRRAQAPIARQSLPMGRSPFYPFALILFRAHGARSLVAIPCA